MDRGSPCACARSARKPGMPTALPRWCEFDVYDVHLCGPFKQGSMASWRVARRLSGKPGANAGAIRADDRMRRPDASGQADGDHASARTDPDAANWLTGLKIRDPPAQTAGPG